MGRALSARKAYDLLFSFLLFPFFFFFKKMRGLLHFSRKKVKKKLYIDNVRKKK